MKYYIFALILFILFMLFCASGCSDSTRPNDNPQTLNWQPIVCPGLTIDVYWRLLQDPFAHEAIVGCVDNRLYRRESIDDDWQLVGQLPDLPYHVLFSPAQQDLVFASSAEGISVSTDGGASWLRQSEQMQFIWALHPQLPGTVIGPASNIRGRDTSAGQVSISRDYGTNWSLLGEVVVDNRDQILDLVVDRHDPTKMMVIIGDGINPWGGINPGLFRSLDGGQTWDRIYSGPVFELVSCPSAADNVYIGLHGPEILILRSSDFGETWQTVGPAPRYASRLVVDSEDADFIATTSESLHLSKDGGTHWIDTGIRASSYIVPSRSLNRVLFPSYYLGVAQVDADGNVIPNTLWEGLPTEDVLSLNDLRASGDGRAYARLGGSNSLVRRNPTTAIWERRLLPFENNGLFVSQAAPYPLYMTEFRSEIQDCVLQSSFDGGDSWEVSPLPESQSHIVPVPWDAELVLSQSLYSDVSVSTDAGNSWQPFLIDGATVHGRAIYSWPGSEEIVCLTDSSLMVSHRSLDEWTDVRTDPRIRDDILYHPGYEFPFLMADQDTLFAYSTADETWQATATIPLYGSNVGSALLRPTPAAVAITTHNDYGEPTLWIWDDQGLRDHRLDTVVESLCVVDGRLILDSPNGVRWVSIDELLSN